MIILVIYDISEDDIRNDVANILKQYGFKRIQKSAFIGKLPSHLLKDLEIKLRKTMKNAHGNIQIFKLSRRQYVSRIEIGQQTNIEHENVISIL